jgi:hypothetical protein
VDGAKHTRSDDGAAPLGRGLRWKPPWEGPFADPTRRLPQAPEVAAERAVARKRWRLRQANRARDCRAAAERDDATDADVAA